MKLIYINRIFHFYERKDGKFEIQLPDGGQARGLSMPDIKDLSDACLDFMHGFQVRAQVAGNIRKAADRGSHGHVCPECGNPWEHFGDNPPCGEPEIKCAKCANVGKAPDLFEETDPR